MKNLTKLILTIQLKGFKENNKISGFTLIELLIAMILAVLIITPLLGTMISLMESDRREQAKSSTEQEVQSAIDYISRDLQQAVYIYDNDGLTKNNNTTDINNSGIKDQIPPVKIAPDCNAANATNCQPVLVFWKREYKDNSIGVSSTTDTRKDGGFAYSLVAYYLIKNGAAPWSSAARISRFEIKGAVSSVNANSIGSSTDDGYSPPPLSNSDNVGTTLKQKMNQWKAGTAAYTQQVLTLVDYISTSNTASPPGCTSPASPAQIVGNSATGFYACVNGTDASNLLAQVYLRGNAYVRLKNNNNIIYDSSLSAYFPSATTQVKAGGFLFSK